MIGILQGNDADSESVPFLPPADLRTPVERASWLMGQMVNRAPAVARPIIRSMLLPQLEQLNDEVLIETLATLQTVILPWVVDGTLPGSQSEPVQDTGG